MDVHHSALLIIVIVQAYQKLENTVVIIALASAAQKQQSRKYCMLVGCFDYFGFNYFGVGFNTRGGSACFWITFLRRAHILSFASLQTVLPLHSTVGKVETLPWKCSSDTTIHSSFDSRSFLCWLMLGREQSASPAKWQATCNIIIVVVVSNNNDVPIFSLQKAWTCRDVSFPSSYE